MTWPAVAAPGAVAVEDLPGDPPTLAPAPVAPTLRDFLLTRAQLADLPQPESLINDTLDQRTVALLAGRSSTGKSFLALDWSCCIATGKPWQGRQAAAGKVLYIAAEGAHGLHQRVSAWEYAWHHQADHLDVLPLPVNLYTGQHFDDLRGIVKAGGYRLVVVDTWARSTVGGKENDNSDSTRAFERADQLRRGDTTVLVVAHTDAGDNKARGATALEDNADTVYRLRGDAGYLELTRTKRKDGPPDDLHLLQLAVVRDSCIVQNTSGQDHNLADRAAVLLSVFDEHFADMGCSKSELRTVAALPPATFARSLKALVSKGFLRNDGSDSRPRYLPGPAHE